MFESLYSQYYTMVLQICLGYMKGDTDVAKDLAQEVFINIWNALTGFRGDSSYKTWIYRITVNTCLLYIRSNKKNVTVPLDATVNLSDTYLVESTKNKHTFLYNIIGQLSHLDRIIIMLFLEELEYEEMAKILGINPVNLRVKIHRIKKKMKELLKQELYNG